jgi:GH15 family glucan-1,4-alpha-glucosidase
VPLTVRGQDAIAKFRLSADDHAWFLLDELDQERLEDSRWSIETEEERVSDAFKETVNFWRHWIGRSRHRGRWSEQVDRSALVLKLLTSQRHDTVVAAPTFGLPEVIGGTRNWDYRYTWIRDSAFVVYALMRLGYTEEEILGHLKGYRGSSPVRIGNNAYRQLQLDIYGELMDSVYLFDKFGYPIAHDLWRDVIRLVGWVCRNWQTRDRSIWEIRGDSHHFLYSRMMCWVALDRAIRLAWKRSLPAPVNEWVETRNRIHREIFDEFCSPELGAFVQHKGSHRVDASHLLMPLVRFISPRDPKWLSTLRAVTNELATDALVLRYSDSHTEWDGLPGTEGTFSMCSFWLVEATARSGDVEQARLIFEKMLGYGNHLGLYAEELGPCGEHLGNYPQAFTQLALISAAFDLNRRVDQSDGD